MKYDMVIYEKMGRVAKVTMNRPEKRNAQSPKMIAEMGEALREAAEDDDVRVIILAGAGPSFSAGHDISNEVHEEMGEGFFTRTDAMMKKEEEIFYDWCLRLHYLPKPTISQVQGYCIMGGMMVATACDLIIASEDAKFADQAVRWTAGCVEYTMYPWDLGIRKAKEFLFTGDYMDAQEAYRLGLVNKVVPRERLDQETMDLAKKIAERDAFMLKLAKKVVNDGLDAMGFRAYLRGAFYLHELAHASMKGAWIAGIPEKGQSVADWARKRDEALGEQPSV